MSELEKQADYYFQITQQSQGNFRVIGQHIFPALVLIGNQDPSLISKHIELLSSDKFLGGSNHLVIESVLNGFKKMIPINLSFRSLIEQKSRNQIEALVDKLIGLSDDEHWASTLKLAEFVMAELDTKAVRMPKQIHISPDKPFDHFETIANFLSMAKEEIYYIDPYLGDDIIIFLPFLRKLDGSNKKLKILTREDLSNKSNLEVAFNCFLKQGNIVELHYDSKKLFHDRWMNIDKMSVYNIGASLNAIAKGTSNKSFDIIKLEEPALSEAKSDLDLWWLNSTKII